MRKIERLRKEALESCRFRGHKMRKFEYFDSKTTAISHCKICGEPARIDSDPPPNGIDIGGRAVALSCLD